MTAAADPVQLPIRGMTCAACAARIEKVLNRLPGVQAQVNFATETAALTFNNDASSVRPDDIPNDGLPGRFRQVF